MQHWKMIIAVLALAGGPFAAQGQPIEGGLSEQQLAEAVRFGRLATLAPLCGLRDGRWAADLRQSAVQSATGADAHDASELQTAPGNEQALAALGFADAEALESFAEAEPAKTCGPLASNRDLQRADDIVRAWRERLQRGKPVG